MIHNKGHRIWRVAALLLLAAPLVILSTRLRADTQTTGTCGGAAVTIPFTDVPNTNIFFCAIAQAYFSGLTNGTSATTYSPSEPVPREQMAAFITRTLDQSLRRGSRRAALNQWWTPAQFPAHARTPVGNVPSLVAADGVDLWVANRTGSVSRVRASDGRLLETWTGATNAFGVLVAGGRIFVTGSTSPGRLYSLDPRQPAGAVTTVADTLGNIARGLTTDGSFIWTTSEFSGGTVSRVNPDTGEVTTFTANLTIPIGILYDGANIWVTDALEPALKKLNADGSIAQTVAVGQNPLFPVFDGANIWVPNANSDSVTVVRAVGPLAGTVLATLTGNGLDFPFTAAFDGQRILVTNQVSHSVSLWKAADLAPLGSVATGANTSPRGACSDGLNFWVTLEGSNRLLRF